MFENSKKTHARDIMTADPVCCLPQDTLSLAARLMRNNDCGALPVVRSHDDRQAVGIITDRDIVVRALAEDLSPGSTRVETCMSQDLCSVGPQESLREIEKEMERHKVRRVLVVDEDQRVIGMVTQAQVVRHAKPEEIAEVLGAISEP